MSGTITCDDLEDSIKLVAPVLTGLSCSARFFSCILNSKRIKCLLDQIQSDWSLISAEEFCILKQFSKRGRLLTILYEVYIYGNLTVYFVNGAAPKILNIIYPLNETRSVRTYKSEYFVAEEKYYFQILFHEYVATFINMTTVLTIDTTYAVLTEHVCGMFAILRHRLKNITHSNECSSKINRFCTRESDSIFNKTINCISLHQRNIEYANTLNSAFSIALFFQTSVCVVSLSITGYMIMIKLNKLDECLQFISYTLVQLLILLYSCIPGEKLQTYSQDAVNSVFDSLWYNMPVSNQKQLMMMMVRSRKSCKLQAGKLFVLSLEFYTSCLQTSFSYFAMLVTIQKRRVM